MTNQQQYDESNIEVLEGLEAVRKRPGMYIGSTGSKGLHHLVYEIVDNSIDEAIMGHCDNIHIIINKDNSVTVKDNGRGIPCGIHPKKKISTLEVILATLHAGGKFGSGGYKNSGGLHGVGSSVVNALSKSFIATVNRDGKMYQQKYEKGKKVTEVEVIGNSNTTGTQIYFYPDETIFSETIYDYSVLETRIRELAFLNKGLKLILEDKREGIEQVNEFKYDGGIKDYIEFLNKGKEVIHNTIPLITKQDIEKDCSVEISFQFINEFNEQLLSFTNNINTIDGGSHVNGFYNGMSVLFSDFARKNGILKEKDNNFTREDVKEGLSVVISTKVNEPEFEGQTKTKLGTTYVQGVVYGALKEFFELYFIENQEESTLMAEKIYQTQQSRLAKKKVQEKSANKNRRKPLPSKLTDATGKDAKLNEIFIVEGDSAGGGVKQACKKKYQGVLKSKGKIMNVEKKKYEEVIKSEELTNFAGAIGLDIGEEFDENKLRYFKICLLQDADLDGGHIRALWYTYLFRYYRELIERGMVYACRPPLYKNVVNKKVFYTYYEEEQEEFLRNNKPTDTQRYKGIGEMNPDQLWDTTLNPETRILEQVTIEDCEKAEEVIEMLMGDDVTPRKMFIKNNSELATLDI